MTLQTATVPADCQAARVAPTYKPSSGRGSWELEVSVTSVPAGVVGSAPAVSTRADRRVRKSQDTLLLERETCLASVLGL